MIKNFNPATVLPFESLISYQEGQVASKTLAQDKSHSLTLFAFEKGEITIGEDTYILQAGESILMPANIEHAVFAPERFKMFLVISF